MTEASTSTRDLEDLLQAARAVSRALDGDELDRELALRDVESVARRCAASSEATQGFAAGRRDDPDLDEDLLSAAVADLDVAAVLLSAGVALEEVALADSDDAADARRRLDATIERVDLEARAAARSDVGASHGGVGAPVDAFGAQPAAELPADSRAAFEAGLARVVDGTVEVFQQAWKQVKSLGPEQLVTAVDAVVDLVGAVPQVGRLVRLGLQAVRRGLEALLRLVPDAVREWAGRAVAGLVAASEGGVTRTAVAAALGAPEVARQIAAGPWQDLPADTSARARSSLETLVNGFASIAGTFTRVLRALAAAGSLAGVFVLFAPVAGWLGAASAVGCALAAGAVIVIARDHLDTEDLVGRVSGLRSIMVTAGVA